MPRAHLKPCTNTRTARRYAASPTERLTALCISPPPRFKALRRTVEMGSMQRTMIRAVPAGALRAGLRIVCMETGAKTDADLKASHIYEVAEGTHLLSIFNTMWSANRRFGVRTPAEAQRVIGDNGDSSGGGSAGGGGAGGGGADGGVLSPDKNALEGSDMRGATGSAQE